MFYTGEDLTQKHGRLPSSNSTLASLNEKKFQRRKSEKDIHNLMFPHGSPTKVNGGRHLGEHETFYREVENPIVKSDNESGFHPNLPDVVSGTDPRNQEIGDKFDQNKAFDLRSTNVTPEPQNPENDISDNPKLETESAMMRLDLRSMNFGEESDPQYTISGKSQNKNGKSGSNVTANNETDTERRTRQKGLKNASNPDMISFREQSEWLDKLVTEELKMQKLKKEKGMFFITLFFYRKQEGLF